MGRRPAERTAYMRRLDRVLDHVRADPASQHTVESLSGVAHFSPFHFHRLFKALIGETVGEFVRRARLERAVALMRSAPSRRLGRIAIEGGFASQSDLTRAFRARYGMPPGRWDRTTPLEEKSKIRQATGPFRPYTQDEMADDAASGRFTVAIRELPEMRVAFIRIADSYTPPHVLEGYTRFIDWLRARNGGAMPDGMLLGMSHDDPDVTPPVHCRYDFCFTVDDDVRPAGECGVRTIPACTVAFMYIVGDVETLVRGWDFLYRWWLPRSRWQPANLPAMELYRRTPEEAGWECFDLDGCVPVEPL
jgi:AraC family transcriptional regulator